MSPVSPPTSTQMLARLLGGSKAASRLGAVVLSVVIISLVVLALIVWPLIRLRTQPAPAIAEYRSDAKLLDEFGSSIDGDLAQIEGRSLFALPAPPSPKADTAQKPDSAKPARYGGPSVIAMINGKVWFSDGQRLGPGESGTGSLKVVALNAPWSAKVEWQGGEFEVEFFQRSPLLLPASASAPAAESATRLSPSPRRRANRPSRRSDPPAPVPAAAAPTPSAAPGRGEPSAPPSSEPTNEDPPHSTPTPEPGDDPRPPETPPAEPKPAPPPGAEPGPDPASDPSPATPPAPPPDPETSRP